ncbi:hypothetical protein BDF20DRAFT_916886 [Mycotypha africana]|uniref:uncharacterized protein n=1 Tax=Mycotypha africana TaxID=64632 RepID=UPI002301409C|nr:uncharacterized protein BDF20DRAFT_916886 [Mycotypha africana]KAI8968345.1 hypothetical protein BDF20DRAFT_916886 [Mycotypha africana]
MISPILQKQRQTSKGRRSQRAPVLNFDRFKSMPKFYFADDVRNGNSKNDSNENEEREETDDQYEAQHFTDMSENSDATVDKKEGAFCESSLSFNNKDDLRIVQNKDNKSPPNTTTAKGSITVRTVTTADTDQTDLFKIRNDCKYDDNEDDNSTHSRNNIDIGGKIDVDNETANQHHNEFKNDNDTFANDMLSLNDDKLRRDLSAFAQSSNPFSASFSSLASVPSNISPTPHLEPKLTTKESAHSKNSVTKQTRESLVDKNTVWKTSISGSSIPYMSKSTPPSPCEPAQATLVTDSQRTPLGPSNSQQKTSTDALTPFSLPKTNSPPALRFDPGTKNQPLKFHPPLPDLLNGISNTSQPSHMPTLSTYATPVQQGLQQLQPFQMYTNLYSTSRGEENSNSGNYKVNANRPIINPKGKGRLKQNAEPSLVSNARQLLSIGQPPKLTEHKLQAYSAKPTPPSLSQHDIQHSTHNISPAENSPTTQHSVLDKYITSNTTNAVKPTDNNINVDDLQNNIREQRQHPQQPQQKHNLPAATSATIKARIAHTLTFQPNTTDFRRLQLSSVFIMLEKTCSESSNWYQLKKLNLSRQHLMQLHDLDQCFPKLEYLNISHNDLRSISGLPRSLIYLYASDNNLTEIKLGNLDRLQHLDISHNSVKYLNEDTMSELKSLRRLDAGHNAITSCKPFRVLSGLVSLNLRNNSLRTLENFKQIMQNNQLETLDVSFNHIESLDSIERLQNLRELYADHNDIMTVQISEPMKRLFKLQLSFNRLKSFDMSSFPEMHVLYLDENQIQRVIGMACVRRLDSFSMRDQGGQNVEYNLQYLRGIRKLYLSGSLFNNMRRLIDFYSLDYLELCAANIEVLPSNFSRHVPNLGTLYLSNNRLTNIRALKRLKYLKRLVLIGNSLMSANEVIEVVRHMRSLQYLDLRNNPMCDQIYPPIYHQNWHPSIINYDEQGEDVNDQHQGVSPYLLAALDPNWIFQDEEFRSTLSERNMWRRQVFRSFLIEHCPKLVELDHLPVTPTSREEAKVTLQRYSSEKSRSAAHACTESEEEMTDIYT